MFIDKRVNLAKPENANRILGIDLGGRTTGKTALALLDRPKNQVSLWPPTLLQQHCQASDATFLGLLAELKPEIIALDAPLSLPDPFQADYLFRPCDRKLSALSPFTLGELTARALYLSSQFPCHWLEVYPKQVLKMLGKYEKGYKKNPKSWLEIGTYVCDTYNWTCNPFPEDIDSVDALLALVAGVHYTEDKFEMIHDSPFPFIAASRHPN